MRRQSKKPTGFASPPPTNRCSDTVPETEVQRVEAKVRGSVREREGAECVERENCHRRVREKGGINPKTLLRNPCRHKCSYPLLVYLLRSGLITLIFLH